MLQQIAMILWSRIAFCVGILFASSYSFADIYTYVDKEGVVHFTNRPRPGRKWKRIMKTGPGKAKVVHANRRKKKLSSDRFHKYDDYIKQASIYYHIPEPLIRAVVRVESDFDPKAVSRVGAKGLMQLMPATAKGMGVTDAFDPRQNIFGGTRYLRILANRFAGDLVLTVAAYHAGPMNIKKYKGIPPFQTTQTYVRFVLKRYNKYRKLNEKSGS